MGDIAANAAILDPDAGDGYQDGFGFYNAYFVPNQVDPSGRQSECACTVDALGPQLTRWESGPPCQPFQAGNLLWMAVPGKCVGPMKSATISCPTWIPGSGYIPPYTYTWYPSCHGEPCEWEFLYVCRWVPGAGAKKNPKYEMYRWKKAGSWLVKPCP